MMETISIRRKGYPIRHLFRDFVDRYRLLAPGIGPSHVEGDCRAAADKICRTALANQDYQIGRTKVFLKVKRRESFDCSSHGVAYRMLKMFFSNKLVNKSWRRKFLSYKIPSGNGLLVDNSSPFVRVCFSSNDTVKAIEKSDAFKSCPMVLLVFKLNFIPVC